jgi:transcription antitermination factor NusG
MLSTNILDDIKRRALEISAEIEVKHGPYRSEIVPGFPARWHVLTTMPGLESNAVAHLVDRGFGIYVPTFERTWVSRSRQITKRLPLFPGHIFLFVWDVLHHWRRIHACPGVYQVLAISERPVVVGDDAIYRMQAIEFSGISLPVEKKAKKRRWRKSAGEKQTSDSGSEIVTISTKSYWDQVTELDDDGRIDVLHRELGLAS